MTRETDRETSDQLEASTREGASRTGRVSLTVLLVGTMGLAWLGAGDTPSESRILAAYAALFVPYLVLVFQSRRDPSSLPSWPILVAVALGLRGLLLPLEPLLSSDIYRYVWDGRVGLAGINPYLYPPSAEELAPIRDGVIWPSINHPDVPTIYPPGAQYLFEGNALLGGGPIGLKGLFVALEALCVGLVGWCLQTGDDAWSHEACLGAFVVYAFNPLVVVETAWSGHLDVAAWMLLVSGMVVTWRRSGGIAAIGGGILIGMSIAVKFLALIVLPAVVWGSFESSGTPWQWRRRLTVVLVALLVAALTYMPFWGAGSDLFEGFGTYAESWRGNDGGYRLLHRASHAALRTRSTGSPRAHRHDGEILYEFDAYDDLFRRMGWTRQWRGETIPATTFSADQLAAYISKAIVAMIVMWVLSLCLVLRLDPLRTALWTLLTLYCIAPVVHPWYVGWLVPLAALRFHTGSLLYSGTVLVAYLAWISARHGGPWHVPDWAVALEYGIVVTAAIVDLSTSTRSSAAPEVPARSSNGA